MNYKMLLSLFVSLTFLVSLVSADISLISPSNSSTLNGTKVSYDVQLVGVPANTVSEFSVSLLDASTMDTLKESSKRSGTSSFAGSFNSIEDGNYYVYVKYFNSTDYVTNKDYLTFFSVDNPLSIGFYDPTPEEGALINSNNIDSAEINAVINKDCNSDLTFDDQMSYSNTSSYSGKSFSYNLLDLYNDNKDGNYTFTVFTSCSDTVNSTSSRSFILKATIPSYEYSSLDVPASVDEDTDFSLSISDLIASEDNLHAKVSASAPGKTTKFLGSYNIDSNPVNLTFSGNLADPGVYSLKLIISDNYGNVNITSLGNLTVNDVADPVVVDTTRRGGRGGSSGEVTNVTTNTTRFDLVRANNNEDNNEIDEEPEVEADSQPGFFSAITGAVTGAFSTPSRSVLTFIIIVVIIYAVVKIRGYMVPSEEKPKKNGKKKKEVSESVESE